MVRRFLIVSAAGLVAAGCSTITEGTTQDIAVTTTPPGATCTLTRDGQALATIARTPGTANVARSSSDILITCHKGGFGDGNYTDQSDLAAATFSNIMTAGVGFAVDLASGAGTKYDGSVNIALAPAAGSVPMLPPLAEPLIDHPSAPIYASGAPAAVPVASAPAPLPLPPAPTPVPPVATAPLAPLPPAAAPAGARRVFGIGVAPLQTDQINASTPKHGVVVVVVQGGSAAARAGLLEGDVVISIGGRDIAEKGDVQRVISSLPAGSSVLVHVIRGAHQLDLTAQL